jgi:hypothetical protein
VRKRVWVLVAVQIAIPLVLLAMRWADPSAGQLRFGWQMHTVCWGREPPCR